MTPNMTLGASLLSQWRKDRGLSQVEACAIIDIDQGWYSKLEHGHRSPGRTLAVKIDRVTGGVVPVSSWDIPVPSASHDQEAKAAS
jgi:transcriptional regulator with XRE-family HTH domain